MNVNIDATSIVCESLSYRYPGGDDHAVADVSFSVEPGEVAALVGPSGCGKSTLLRLVAGLLTPTSGSLLMDGADATGIPAERRNVGWVPQSYALFGHLTVAENVEFGLKARGVGRTTRTERVDEALSLCRITDFADRRPDDLSGGQRQRVAIARALATRPRVLLLDEPLSALDPQLRRQLRADLSALLERSGVTTLLVTHDQGEALAMADMVAVMRDGRVQQYASPRDLWSSPANGFVAEFVSEAHILEAKRVDGVFEVVPGLALPNVDAATEGVRIALRPGDLAVVEAGAPLTVETVEYAGNGWLVAGKLSNGDTISVYSDTETRRGDTVTVSVLPHKVIATVNE